MRRTVPEEILALMLCILMSMCLFRLVCPGRREVEMHAVLSSYKGVGAVGE